MKKQPNTEQKILGHGSCKHCGAAIRWVITARGKFMPLEANDSESHFPHCGKQNWSAEEWADYLAETARKIREKNIPTEANKYLTTNPKRLTQFYSGERPPWDYPTFIECVE